MFSALDDAYQKDQKTELDKFEDEVVKTFHLSVALALRTCRHGINYCTSFIPVFDVSLKEPEQRANGQRYPWYKLLSVSSRPLT